MTSDFDNIDIMCSGISKAESIQILMKRYGIAKDDAIVIGDSENDIGMFKLTEKSYCMSHASEYVKSKASFLIDSVSEAIEKELNTST